MLLFLNTLLFHDGSPRDSTAKNYYVKYKDYIKMWRPAKFMPPGPQIRFGQTFLRLCLLRSIAFIPNGIGNKGYDFTITSSTAFDHKWIPERNVYESISVIVDELFANYLSRPNVRQPILTQYCDGKMVSCPNWMTQGGRRNLEIKV